MRVMSSKNSKAKRTDFAILGLIDDIVMSLFLFQDVSERKTDGATLGCCIRINPNENNSVLQKRVFQFKAYFQSSELATIKMSSAIYLQQLL
jgi:hypothetical protein